jgi:hypothetical protein
MLLTGLNAECQGLMDLYFGSENLTMTLICTFFECSLLSCLLHLTVADMNVKLLVRLRVYNGYQVDDSLLSGFCDVYFQSERLLKGEEEGGF